MSGYDRGGYDLFRRGRGHRHRGYGGEYPPAPWGRSGGPEGGWEWGAGRSRGAPGGRAEQRWVRDFDRGVYGGSYPTYGGYPGSGERGMYYAGRGYRGLESEYGRQTGLPSPYDRGFSRQRTGPESGYSRGPAGRPRGSDDADLRDEIRHNLYNDTWLDAERIDVQVRDGVVTLTGEVDDYMEARYAWDDAWEASGVRGVVSQLTVRASSMPSTEKGPAPVTSAEEAREGPPGDEDAVGA